MTDMCERDRENEELIEDTSPPRRIRDWLAASRQPGR